MKNHQEKQLDQIFDALSHRHRRAMVHRLSLQPMTISALAIERGLSLPAIHKHVIVLERVGLVQRKKNGRCNFLALDRNALENCRKWLAQYHSYWGSNDESLENHIASLRRESRSNLK